MDEKRARNKESLSLIESTRVNPSYSQRKAVWRASFTALLTLGSLLNHLSNRSRETRRRQPCEVVLNTTDFFCRSSLEHSPSRLNPRRDPGLVSDKLLPGTLVDSSAAFSDDLNKNSIPDQWRFIKRVGALRETASARIHLIQR